MLCLLRYLGSGVERPLAGERGVKSLLANDPSHTEGGGTSKRSFGGRQGQS